MKGRTSARAICSAVVIVGTVLTAPASAQILVGRPPPQPAHEVAASPQRDTTPLRGYVGIAAAERLFSSDEPDDRLRGIERLAAIGTPEAIDKLADNLDREAIKRDPRARLEGVRALAAHVDRDAARQLLERELTEVGPGARANAGPLAAMVRQTAALALARSGDKKCITSLATALLQPGPAADAAAEALLAYPPSSLQPLLETKRTLPIPLVTFLGRLGDMRAIPRLRAMLEQPDVATKIAVALALARLGDDTPAPLARAWVRRPDPILEAAGAEVLAELGASDAPAAIAALLTQATTRDAGLRLALVAPAPELVKPLASAIGALPADAREKAVAAIGRAGGDAAVRALAPMLANPELATAAAFALATFQGPSARAALETALPRTTREAKRTLLRAAIVRALVVRDSVGALERRLADAARSNDAADRAVGVFGLVALGATSAERAASPCAAAPRPGAPRCDDVALDAAAAGALARGPDALRAFLPILEAATDEPSSRTVAAGVALVADPLARPVATSRLATWAEEGGALAPLAARALPTRDDDVLRPRIKRLLAGTDPVVRAHVALGLARDPLPDAVTLLARAYRFEEDAGVRAAIVRALSRRTEVQRTATLTLARDLDADASVRSLASAALAGRVLDHVTPPSASGRPGGLGPFVSWISIAANDASARGSVLEGRSARLVRSDGLALPVVAAPDGVVLVPGLPPGLAAITLAPR